MVSAPFLQFCFALLCFAHARRT